MKRVFLPELMAMFPDFNWDQALNMKNYEDTRGQPDYCKGRITLEMMKSVCTSCTGSEALELMRSVIGMYDVDTLILEIARSSNWKETEKRLGGENGNYLRKLKFFKEQTQVRALRTVGQVPKEFWETWRPGDPW